MQCSMGPACECKAHGGAILLIAPAMRRSGTILGVAEGLAAERALETCENIAFPALGGGAILTGAVYAFNSCWKVYS